MNDEKKIKMKKGKSKLSGRKKERMKTKGRATTVENSESPNPFDLKHFFYPRDTDPLPRPAEQKENFRIFAEEATKAGINKLIEKFNKKVKIYQTPNNKRIAYEANKRKNRYSDIPCLDATRVVLDDKVPRGDYIHANCVKGLYSNIILTQV
ncbi:hypothetical protein WR25_19357 [Diploscapter pachys]|uniref:Tyrosine-protein phosphatase domain-containing protein n=1 Tax=Diploscapter pachys TaxID=2018661 RepID=A0A2A2L6W2_9BILA|nr:hypothetical protein WR25_19357 [Diploscapter pachys]